MSLPIMIHFTCPYCQIKGRYDRMASTVSTTSEVMWCPLEDGGCDRRFVLDFSLNVQVKTHKIEEAKS